MLARIECGPRRNDVTWDWKLHDLFSSPNIIQVNKPRRIRCSLHVARMEGKMEVAYRILVRKPEGRGPLGIPRHKWEDNNKVDLKNIGYGQMAGSC
jgi:hypothetical protein